jgi:hypothetical protein
MYKMVNVGCHSALWACVSFDKKERAANVTHHSGQISSRQGTCIRIEECCHTDTHHNSIMYKSEVIDKHI